MKQEKTSCFANAREQMQNIRQAQNNGMEDTQVIINKAVGYNQVIKIVALVGDEKHLFFDELKKDSKLLEVIAKKPIKPISFMEKYSNKVYKFRLKPGKYLVLVSTKRKETTCLDFSLVEVYLTDSNKFDVKIKDSSNTHAEFEEYYLSGIIDSYQSVKGLFMFN